MGRIVGIDLGTSNTVVAIMDGPRPRVLDSREGRPQIRSVVGLKRRRGKKGQADGEEVLVGDAAVDNWGMAPEDTIVSIKRLMGRGVSDPEVRRTRGWVQYRVVAPSDGTKDSIRVILGGEELSPIDVSAMILRKVKEDAEYRLGESVSHAVITVPAYFSQIQRDATRKAGLKAGLQVIKILDEPTAAAVAFGTDSPDGEPRTILVYDLGGGTFDVSLLMLAGNVFAPLNLEGDMWLGGDNLDQVIVDRALEWLREEFEIDPTSDKRFMAELHKASQSVKERLSATSTADLVVAGMLRDHQGNLIDVDIEITRAEYERLIARLVSRYRECGCGAPNHPDDERCIRCGQSLGQLPLRDGRAIRIVRKALENANQTVDQIDHVLMAGNSTMVPLVQQTMEEMFGSEKVLRKVHPKHSVAMGAAIVAAWIGNRVVCQAPDPADPSQECGHVNEHDATICASCGAPLGLVETEPQKQTATEAYLDNIRITIGTVGEMDRISGTVGEIEIGGIAPFHYGTQTAGDTFNLFIRKGDPYPTEDPKTQTFYTRAPNQRMVSIPVYGGDTLEKASANELQGQAFALLPPSLPQETPVRIELSLDDRGIFALRAWLHDETALDPWIVHGEADAKAIEAIERLEGRIVALDQGMAVTAVREVEAARGRVYDRMRERNFADAISEVQEAEKLIDEATKEDGADDLRQRAEGLIGYTEFMLQQYGWMMTNPQQLYHLAMLAEQTREALAADDPDQLQALFSALDTATDQLPDILRFFMGMRSAILGRVQPFDPRVATELLEEMEQIETRLKQGDHLALERLGPLGERIGEKIKEIESHQPGGFRCPSCNQIVAAGSRYCVCGEDTWQLGAGLSTSGLSR
jgi:molecular chaperone DnaK